MSVCVQKVEATNCFIVVNVLSIRRNHSFSILFIEELSHFAEIYESELNTLYYIEQAVEKNVAGRFVSCMFYGFVVDAYIPPEESFCINVWKWNQQIANRFKNGAQIFQVAFKTKKYFYLFCSECCEERTFYSFIFRVANQFSSLVSIIKVTLLTFFAAFLLIWCH